MEEEDEDIVWEGSPLDEHLKNHGLDSDSISISNRAGSSNESSPTKALAEASRRPTLAEYGASVVWPDESNSVVEIEVAQKLIESELLVQEDEDFITNFILTDEALDAYSNRSSGSGSLLSDFLLFSGSLAAVAGTVLFLSERTRLAATAASVLPTALAAVSSMRMGAKVSSQKESEKFHKLVDQLLSDMMSFKKIIRKSLSLLQGMELMNSGYMFAVNTQTGAPSTVETSKLSKALSERSAFPALRQAAYKCTVQMILAYREAVSTLFNVSPLADHVDFKDHYIAFIELSQFGINDETPESEDISVRALKDVVQVALIQQSEYLRRFSLSFSEKVRDDQKLDKEGVLRHVKELIHTIKKVNTKLSQVFEYHQALGTVSEAKHKALMEKRSTHLANFVPLRSVYTSLFSTGLHLQNSLMKVRHMEKAFEVLEKSKQKREIENMMPDDGQLVEWMKGFQEIQTELGACVNCLEDGVGQIDILQAKDDEDEEEREAPLSPQPSTSSQSEPEKPPIKITDDEPQDHIDEVFEAFVVRERFCEESGNHDEFSPTEKRQEIIQKKQSQVVLQELKRTLVGKAKEHEIREARAIARQKGEPLEKEQVTSEEIINGVDVEKEKILDQSAAGDAFGYVECPGLPKSNSNNQFGDSFVDFVADDKHPDPVIRTDAKDIDNGYASSDTDSSESDRATVKSFDNNKLDSPDQSSKGIPRSISGQLLCDDTTTDDFSDSDSESNGFYGMKATPSVMSLPVACGTSIDEEEKLSRSMAELRSLSQPDLKKVLISDSTSPYISMEEINKEYKTLASQDSDDWGSADELDHHVLKTYKRPLRPAAKSTRTRSRRKDEDLPSSTYVNRNHSEDNPLSVPRQPLGFDSALAAQVARRAALFRNGGCNGEEKFCDDGEG